MTGKELYAKLKESGTGAERLAILRRYLASHPDALAADTIAAMERYGWPFGAVTLGKAREFAGLVPPAAEHEAWMGAPAVPEEKPVVPEDEPPPLPQHGRGGKMPRRLGPMPASREDE